ncbi:hypothetical protein D3C76_1634170 [compost metagenome]
MYRFSITALSVIPGFTAIAFTVTASPGLPDTGTGPVYLMLLLSGKAPSRV